jgi:hypothetical protein
MANQYGPRIVTDNLVLCLDASDKNSYSGSGPTWYDLSGNNYNATIYNSPNFSNGYLQFRSATTNSKYATTTFDEGVLRTGNQTGQWTIETVFKYISTPSSSEAVVAGRAGCHGGIYLYTDATLYQAIKTDQCWTGAVNTYVNSLSANIIYHSVMTYNNGTVRHYLNGRKNVTDSTLNLSLYSIYGYSTTFYIGGIPYGNPELYCTNTDIAIVRCYKKQLTDAEVLQNYNMTKTKFNI